MFNVVCDFMHLDHMNFISFSSLFIFCVQFLYLLVDHVSLPPSVMDAPYVLVYSLSYTIVEGTAASGVWLLGQR
jgi:hypothetical protein